MRRPLEIELKIEHGIIPILSSMSCDLMGMHLSAGKSKDAQHTTSILRVYIDKPGGILIADIARASRKIGTYLEVENIIPGRYTLEVSSPGLDRILFKPEHFSTQIGHKIRISLCYPQENQKNFQGILKSVEGDFVSLLIEESNPKQHAKMQTFSFEQIDKARLVPDIKMGTASKGKKRGVEKE